jgi:hypothetical protein
MKTKHLLLACVLCLLVPSMASAAAVEYSYAQLYTSNQTVDLVPLTSNSSGALFGVKCIFPSNDNGAEIKVTVTLDGTASSFIIDPGNLEREANGAGQYLSGWIPFDIGFSSSIHVTLNNTNLGTAQINCWASWYHN